MTPYIKHLSDSDTECIHDNTTYRKKLIAHDEHHRGDIATANYAWIVPGMQLTPHTHADGEEFYLFLEGHGQMLVGTEWFDVGPQDFVTVPIGHEHSVKNTSDTNLVFITVRTVDSSTTTS